MPTVALRSTAPLSSPSASSRRLLPPALLLRFALVAAAVGICYLLPWHWLEALTADFNTALDRILGIPWTRLSPDTVAWNGVVYEYVISCTFADVWCGAIPLVWNLRRSLLWNAGYLAVMAAGMFAFNIFRLSLSDYVFAMGVPWSLAHSVVSGIAYFSVWVWLWERHSDKWFHRNKAASIAAR